ncbi:MAG: hypothetical protein Q7J67_03625 [bacterium]|nr:hypothetical protein [bacterium]
MILRISLLVLSFVLIGNSSMAGELVLSPEVEELRLAVDKPAVFSFVKQDACKTYLSFLIRSEPEKAKGYTKGLVIHINGTRIKTLERLINKPFKYKVEEETNDWCNAHGIWTVPVSGDYSLFVFDITDLIKNKNRIIFLRVPHSSSEAPFFLKEAKIIYESGDKEPSPEKAEEKVKPRKEEISSATRAKTEHPKNEVNLTRKEREVKATALEPVSFSFALPEVKEAYLSFLVRTKSRKPAGYVSALIIKINGTQIKDIKRLINKRTTGESNVTSYGLWKAPKSRDYSSFVFDISDLVKKENKLVFKRVLSSDKSPLYFKQVKVMYE